MRVARRVGPLGRQPWVVLAPLALTQWIVVAIFALSVQRNGWLFYQGGDQTWFYTSAWALTGGHIAETFVGWAWPLILTPVVALAGPNFLAGLPAIVLFQVLVLCPLGLLCVYGIASRIGGRLLGYWAAAWWIAVPFLVIPLFVDRYHDTFVDQVLPQGFGMTGLGDFPSMIALLVAAFFSVRGVETRARADVIAAGLAAGIAVGIKPSNGLFVFAPLAAFALTRHWRGWLDFTAAFIPGLVVLALWKEKGSGIPLLVTDPIHLAASATPKLDWEPKTFWERVTQYVPLDRHQLNQQFLGFREFFWSARVLEFVPVAGALAVARRSVTLAVFFAVWLGAFFVVKGSSPAVDVTTGSIWRLLMPAWPAYFLLGASIPLLVPRLGPWLANRSYEPARPLPVGPRTIAAVGAAAFALPALAFLALPSENSARAAEFPHRSLYVPVDDNFRLSGRGLEDGSVRITWPAQPGHADSFYVILRSPARYVFPSTADVVVEGLRCKYLARAIHCTFEMDEAARTAQRSFRDAPPPGEYTYRVAVAANWVNDVSQGDVLVVSEPLDVVIR